MKGLLIFFQDVFTDGEYDAEATCFQNPKLTDVSATVKGISHKIYKQGPRHYHHWSEIKPHFMPEN
jgi:hypothetical protein